MITVLKSLPSTGVEVVIPYNTTTATIIQNLSEDYTLWSATSGGNAWNMLYPKDFIRVDFDVFMKSPNKQVRSVCITQ